MTVRRVVESALPGADPLPAGFLARQVAWSLDAVPVAIVTWVLSHHAVATAMRELNQAWAGLSQLVVAQLAAVLGQAVDPFALATQLTRDPVLHAAAASVEASLWALLLPPMLAFAAVGALYWIGFERSAWQATPGKRALALQVTDLHGQRLGLMQAALRHFGGALSWLTFNLGHALAALPPQKRALHDYLAGTRVIHVDGDPRLPGWAKAWIAVQVALAFLLPLWLGLRQATALLGNLSQV